MTKLKAAVLVTVATLLTNGTQFYIQHRLHKNEMTQLEDKMTILQSKLDEIGPITECYTPAEETFAGQEITEENLYVKPIPKSFMTRSFVTDKTELIGKYFKIALTPGTPITADTVMEEPIDDTTREVDITGNRWPVGLKEGDYIDYRITYPHGEDFIVLSHLRVMSVEEQSLKVHMSEPELHRYQAALVDFFLNRDKGADVYLIKYVEPGVQKSAAVYYSVPKNIEAMMQIDPNIVNKAEATLNAGSRPAIEGAIGSASDDEGSKLNSGRAEMNGKINNDYMIHKTVEKEKVEQTEQNAEGFSEVTGEE